jgi:hypothetical protein
MKISIINFIFSTFLFGEVCFYPQVCIKFISSLTKSWQYKCRHFVDYMSLFSWVGTFTRVGDWALHKIFYLISVFMIEMCIVIQNLILYISASLTFLCTMVSYES